MNQKILDIFSRAIVVSAQNTEHEHALDETFKSKHNLKIYRINYIEGLIQSLITKFPTSYMFCGENNFRYISYQYIKLNPPSKPDKNTYGNDFPLFINSLNEVDDKHSLINLLKLDLFLTQVKITPDIQITLPRGTFKLWLSVIKNKKYKLIPNSDAQETLGLKDETLILL